MSDGQFDECVRCHSWQCHAEHNPFVYCDGEACRGKAAGWHLFCTGDIRLPAPREKWFCPTCRKSEPMAAPTTWAGRESYVAAARPKLNKAKRRAEAGLAEGGLATAEETERLLAAASAPATRAKAEQVSKRFKETMSALQASDQDPGAVERYAASRVKQGKAASTIKQEIAILHRAHPQTRPDPDRTRTLMRAVDRLADQPDAKKAPITANEMHQLHGEIVRVAATKGGAEGRHLKARDWAFYLLMFLGLLRAGEAVALDWADVLLLWEPSPGAPLVEKEFGWRPRDNTLRPVGALLVIKESKTDRGAKGQSVRIKAGSEDDFRCPVRALRELWEFSAPPFTAVFVETRNRKPTRMTDDTLRRRFKEYAAAFIDPKRVEKLSLHSFRKGGASTAANQGAKLNDVQEHGRWVSDVYLQYVWTSDQAALDLTGKIQGAMTGNQT